MTIRDHAVPGLLALTLAAALAMFGMTSATAAPFSKAVGPVSVLDRSNLIHKIHGCHRNALIGPRTGRLHRHVGRFCRWQRVRLRPRVVRRCVRWRRTCARRWGGGWRYRRCLRRHAC